MSVFWLKAILSICPLISTRSLVEMTPYAPMLQHKQVGEVAIARQRGLVCLTERASPTEQLAARFSRTTKANHTRGSLLGSLLRCH